MSLEEYIATDFNLIYLPMVLHILIGVCFAEASKIQEEIEGNPNANHDYFELYSVIGATVNILCWLVLIPYFGKLIGFWFGVAYFGWGWYIGAFFQDNILSRNLSSKIMQLTYHISVLLVVSVAINVSYVLGWLWF